MTGAEPVPAPGAVARLRLWLASSPLFVRLAWGIVIGFVLLHAASGAYQAHQSLVNQASQLVLSIAERARVIDGLTVNRSDRADAFAKISDAGFSIELVDRPVSLPDDERRWHNEPLVRERAAAGLSELGFKPDEVKFTFVFRRRAPRLLLSIPTSADKAGRWLLVSAAAQPARWQRHTAGLVWTSMLALLILGLVLWATRRFTRFLPAFVAAAERVGSMVNAENLPEEGPREIRRLSVAFNTMQAKVQAHEQERRTMLGAVSHDLRTLVTRLTLRLERLAPLSGQDKIREDLESMTRIVDEALAFARDESNEEPFVRLEFRSLVQTVVDGRNEAAALDLDVESAKSAGDAFAFIEGVLGPGEPMYLLGQPVALKRALLNVLDNAVLYGGAVRVELWQEDRFAVVRVTDGGTGIPASEQRRVVQPYVRLEESRNRATGGTGLGLAIANNVVGRHKGRLSFEQDPQGNGEAGGRFGVRLELPLGTYAGPGRD